ncbi:hypothetical protein MLD38_003085 [Melastoma candidum]|uniref:Uncharacterized protein n=1 Tax=Melastoma candidum TaxID=119954 RepID=A0ACB9S4L5_9MYRT|nr:hypothetical protein MLD38_003085 [Melastoma candidum]
MDALVRTNTLSVSTGSRFRAFSRRGRSRRSAIAYYDHRQERAKHRRAFLKTYRLGSVGGSERGRCAGSCCDILGESKAVARVKAAAARFIRFARDGLVGWSSCYGRSAITASSPVPGRHFVR